MAKPQKANALKLTSEEKWALFKHGAFKVGKVLLAVALVAGSAFLGRAGYQLVMTTPYLHLQEIEVRGASRADVREIERLAGPLVGQHILHVDTRAAAERVVKHPWISWVEVRRRLPHKVVINVLEREPAAILAAGELYYVDAGGRPFKKLGAGDDLDLPLITGFEDRASVLRTDATVGQRAVREALLVLDRVSTTGWPLASVSEVHLDLEDGYSLFLAGGGAEVVLGWRDFDARLRRLDQLMTTQGLNLNRVARVNLDLELAAVVTALPPVGKGGLTASRP